MNFTACAPEKYFPDKALISECEALAKESGATLRFESDVVKATKNADVIYTDVWVSMGEPVEFWKERIDQLAPYAVTKSVMKKTLRVMLCLCIVSLRSTTLKLRLVRKLEKNLDLNISRYQMKYSRVNSL